MKTDNNANSPRWASFLFRYILGAIVVYWLVNTNSIDFGVFELIDLRVATIALILVGIQFFLAGLRIAFLLKSVGINIGIWRCSLYNAVGIFFSIFLPGGISGDVARAYYFLRCHTAKGISKTAMLGILLTDRIIGSAVMIMIGLGACTFVADTLGIASPFLIASWIAFVGGCFIYLWLCQVDLRRCAVPNSGIVLRLLNRVASLLSHMDVRSHSRETIAISIALSLGIHLCGIALISSFADLLKTGLSFWHVMGIAPFGLLVNMTPLSPGGLGIGEQGFQSLFALAGGSQGGNTFLLSRIFFSSPAILGLVVLVQSFIKAHRVFRLSEFDVALHPSSPVPSSKDKALSDGVRSSEL
jgi:uncharacterized protein (TIRG00374 family)